MARGSAHLGGRGRGRSGSAESVPELGDAGNGAPSPARNILPGEPFEPLAASFGHGPDPLVPSGWGADGPGFNSQAPLTWGADPSTAPLTAVGTQLGAPGQPGVGQGGGSGADPLDALQQYAGLPLGAGYGAAPAPDPSQVYQGYGATPVEGGFAGGGLFSGGEPAAEASPAAFVPHPAAPADVESGAATVSGGQPLAAQASPGQQFAAQPFAPQAFEGQQAGTQPFTPPPFQPQPFQPQQFQGQQFQGQPFAPQSYGAQPFPSAPAGPDAFPGLDQPRAVEQLPAGSAEPLDVTPTSTVLPGSPFDRASDEGKGGARRRRRPSGRRGRESGHRPSDVEHRTDLGLEAFTGPEASRSGGARRPLALLGVVAVLGAAGFVGYTQLSGTDDAADAGRPIPVAKPATSRYPLPSTLGTSGQIPADQAKALKTSWTALAKLTLPDLPPPLVVSAYGPVGAKPTTNVVVYAPGAQSRAIYEALIGSLSRPVAGSSATVAKPAVSGSAGGEVMCGSQASTTPSAWCAFTSPKGVGFVHVDGTARAEDAATTTRELRAFSER